MPGTLPAKRQRSASLHVQPYDVKSDAMVSLVKLLAKQAARELLADFSEPPSPEKKKENRHE